MTSNERVLKAIDEIKKGRMVVMVDDEDRENEGDIVFAATFSTPELINFTITEAKGILCTPVTREIAKKLDFMPMVEDNSSQHATAFTVTVDAVNAKTGVSAYERDECIKLIANPNSKPKDFVRPGHIFPLIAKDGGVLVRTGHTEGTVDLCKLAGLYECGICCEIVKEDGEMARRDDLEIFCEKHSLHMVQVSDLVEYRLQHESLIKVFAEENVTFMGKEARKYEILDHQDKHHVVYSFGEIKSNSAVKFHTVRSDLELLKSDESYNNLMRSIDYLQKNSGLLIFLNVDENKNEIMKEFGIGAQIIRYFGIEKIDLLTKNRQREYVGLGGFGLEVAKVTSF